MPIFEYRCTSCGERYETLVSRAERATPRCPRCGGAQAERLISTFAVGRARPTDPSGLAMVPLGGGGHGPD